MPGEVGPGVPRHGVLRSAVLHLAPGLAMLGFYLLAAPWFMARGYPPLMASLVTIPLILAPWMLGYLAWEGRRRSGSFDVLAAVTYRARVSRLHYLVFGLPILLWGAVVFGVADAWLTPRLVEGLSAALPRWFLAPVEVEELVAMPTGSLVAFLGALVLFAGIVAPVIEELYFRGHLLPAVQHWGPLAPVITVALFTLYHFESPWEGPGRFLVVLPMVLVVWRTRSVRFGIVVHVALNLLSALALTVAVIGMRAA
jgi:uncharacterized protein